MKFNLKNRPKPEKAIDPYVFTTDIEKWFEGFEKELREQKAQLEGKVAVECQNTWFIGAPRLSDVGIAKLKKIKEILGDGN